MSGGPSSGVASPAAATLEEIRPGIYAWVQPDGSWWINNAGAVAGDDGVLVVDTCATAERTRRFLSALDATTDIPIRYAVNTHLHGDHTYGNSLLPSSATLIGHERMREGLAADVVIDGCPPFWAPVPDWGPVERRLPNIAVNGSSTVHLGDRSVELLHPGWAAHTTGDLVAWVPQEGVVFAGDLVFAGLTPLAFMGSVTGALDAIDWLAGLGADVVVPGHGPVLTGEQISAVFDEHRRYYRLVLDLAADGMARSLDPLEVARGADLGDFATWLDAERLVLNLHRVYADRQGLQLDPATVLLDAVALLGGPMPTYV